MTAHASQAAAGYLARANVLSPQDRLPGHRWKILLICIGFGNLGSAL
jgi:hypothetical protein